MVENLTKNRRRIWGGGVLFAVCCAVETCFSMIWNMFLPMKFSMVGEAEIMDWMAMGNYIFIVLDIGVLAGIVLIISGVNGVLPMLSEDVGGGLKWVCRGMLLLAGVRFLCAVLDGVIAGNAGDLPKLQALSFLLDAVAACVGWVVTGVGFGWAGRRSQGAMVSRELWMMMAVTVLIAVLQLFTLASVVVSLILSDSPDKAEVIAPLMIIEILLVKPVRIVGFILFAAAWVKLVRALRGNENGQEDAYGNRKTYLL